MTEASTRPMENIADVPLMKRGHGEVFQVKWRWVGPVLALAGLGCAVHVVPPGKRAFAFHRHHVIDEMFFIVPGEGQYRYGDETFPVRSGDIIGAPAGAKAHQLINTGKEDLRYLGISTIGGVDAVDYPDSGKVGIGAGIKSADFKTATYAAMGRITPADYWDGEDAPGKKQ